MLLPLFWVVFAPASPSLLVPLKAVVVVELTGLAVELVVAQSEPEMATNNQMAKQERITMFLVNLIIFTVYYVQLKFHKTILYQIAENCDERPSIYISVSCHH